MKNTLSTILVLVVAGLFMSGCSEDINSDDIRTAGIYATMTVEATASNASSVKVVLKSGGVNSNTYVNLTSDSGDTLTATINSNNAQNLSKQSAGQNNYSYITNYSIAGAGDANAEYTIAFTRPADTSAPASKVSLPEPISNFTADKTSFSRATDVLVLTWSSVNVSAHLALKATGDCIHQYSKSVADAGSYTVNKGDISSRATANSCTIVFTLSRSKAGTLDPVFVAGEGGTITATQTRSLAVTSTP